MGRRLASAFPKSVRISVNQCQQGRRCAEGTALVGKPPVAHARALTSVNSVSSVVKQGSRRMTTEGAEWTEACLRPGGGVLNFVL